MDRRAFAGLATVAAASLTAAPAVANATPKSGGGRGDHRPHELVVVGHRGASGYRPEHTEAAYALAAYMGADYIEPDLVITSDGVLVCRHENEISGTTDVSERREFGSRKTTKIIDGVETTGWFTEDFTLAELRTLRAKERLPQLRQHNTIYDGLWQVPTFEEILKLRRQLSEELGREIGIYPETKHPTYYRTLGKPLEEPLMRLVRQYRLDAPNAPIYIQSFELNNLLDMRMRLKTRAPLVFLTVADGTPFADERSYAELLTREGMRGYAKSINALGPAWTQVIATNSDGTLGSPTSLVEDAHANGLEVCPWTVRAENEFLPTDYRIGDEPAAYGRVIDLLKKLYATDIDGIFCDMPDIAALVRDNR